MTATMAMDSELRFPVLRTGVCVLIDWLHCALKSSYSIFQNSFHDVAVCFSSLHKVSGYLKHCYVFHHKGSSCIVLPKIHFLQLKHT